MNAHDIELRQQTEEILSHQALLAVATLPTSQLEMCERIWAAFKLGQQYQKILDNALPLTMITPNKDENGDELCKQCERVAHLNNVMHNHVFIKANDKGEVTEVKSK